MLKELILAGEKNNRRGGLESAVEQFFSQGDASALVGLLRAAGKNSATGKRPNARSFVPEKGAFGSVSRWFTLAWSSSVH